MYVYVIEVYPKGCYEDVGYFIHGIYSDSKQADEVQNRIYRDYIAEYPKLMVSIQEWYVINPEARK